MSATSRKKSLTSRSLPPQTQSLPAESPALPDEEADVVRRTATWTFSLPSLFSRGPSVRGDGSVESSSDDIPAAEGEDTDGNGSSTTDEDEYTQQLSRKTSTSSKREAVQPDIVEASNRLPEPLRRPSPTLRREKIKVQRRTDDEGSQGDVELSASISKSSKRQKKPRPVVQKASSGRVGNSKELGKMVEGGKVGRPRRILVQTMGANAWDLIGGPTEPDETADEGLALGASAATQQLKLIKVIFHNADSTERTEMVSMCAINTWKKLHTFFELNDFTHEPDTQKVVVRNELGKTLTEAKWPPQPWTSNTKHIKKPLQILKTQVHVYIKDLVQDTVCTTEPATPLEKPGEEGAVVSWALPADYFTQQPLRHRLGTVTATVVVYPPQGIPLDITLVTRDDVRIMSARTIVHCNDGVERSDPNSQWILENDEDYVYLLPEKELTVAIPDGQLKGASATYHELKLVFEQARIPIVHDRGAELILVVSINALEETLQGFFGLLGFPELEVAEYIKYYHDQLLDSNPKYVQLEITARFGTTFIPSLAPAAGFEMEPKSLLSTEYHEVFIYFRPISEDLGFESHSAIDVPTLASLREQVNFGHDWNRWSRMRVSQDDLKEYTAGLFSFGGTILAENEGSTRKKNPGRSQRRKGPGMDATDGNESGPSNYDTDGSLVGVSMWVCCNPDVLENHPELPHSRGDRTCDECGHRRCDICEAYVGRLAVVRGKNEVTYIPNQHQISVPENAAVLLGVAMSPI